MTKKKSTAFTDADYVIKTALEPIEDGTSGQDRESYTDTQDRKSYVIEKVPIPRRTGRKGLIEYPIGSLTAGSDESFLVPAAEPVTPEALQKLTGSIRTYAYRNDFKVTLRSEAGGVRVWRKK